MSMDLYNRTFDGVTGFFDKADMVCEIKGTRKPKHAQQSADALSRVREMFLKPREEALIAAVRTGDVQQAEQAAADYAAWCGADRNLLSSLDQTVAYTCSDEWDSVVVPNHDALVGEFNRSAGVLAEIVERGLLFTGTESTELVRSLEKGGNEQFEAVVKQREACANLTKLARLMMLNMSLGMLVPVSFPEGIETPHGRSDMLAVACFTPNTFDGDGELFPILWRRLTATGDIDDEAWASLAENGFLPHARKWVDIYNDSQANSNDK